MIDQTVFNEMMDRGFITNVGLNPADFKDIDELMDLGLVTSIAGDDVYNDLVNSMSDAATANDEPTVEEPEIVVDDATDEPIDKTTEDATE